MKSLLRLYPSAWRKRYGAEMEVLVDDMGGRFGVAVDLVIGAAVAYRDVIRGNRILAAAGACLHGICVAVLVQAIGFVTLILVTEQTSLEDVRLGPVDLVSIVPNGLFESRHELAQAVWIAVHRSWVPEAVLLLALLLALAFVLATPRLIRRLA